MIKRNKNTLILTSIIILLPIIAGIILWNKLPDTMAIHFGADNAPNGFGNKIFTVLGMPVILLLLQIFCAVVTAMDPKRQNISDKIYTLVLWIVPVVSIICSVAIYSYNLGIKGNVSFYAGIITGLIFIIIGNYLPKARQNYTIGIKLPWTLANEENWNKTHRLAGVIWIIVGIILMLLSFTGLIGNEYILLSLILIAVIIPSVYSFYLHAKKGL